MSDNEYHSANEIHNEEGEDEFVNGVGVLKTNEDALKDYVEKIKTALKKSVKIKIAKQVPILTSKTRLVQDYFAIINISPEDFLKGQRAVSKLQIAREGPNVHVVRHVRENMEMSYKELFVDVTQKLPSFAKAVLPQFVLYMENCVNFPRNTASLCCVHPKALRGVSTFAETFYGKASDFDIINDFTLQVTNENTYDAVYVNYEKSWKDKPRELYQNMQHARCVVYKRFSIDVCSDSFFYRKLRDVMIKKFVDAFIDMVREVESLVLSWEKHVNPRPRFESVTTSAIAPKIPKLWPYENGNNDFSIKAGELLGEFKSLKLVNGNNNPRVTSSERRNRASSSIFNDIGD